MSDDDNISNDRYKLIWNKSTINLSALQSNLLIIFNQFKNQKIKLLTIYNQIINQKNHIELICIKLKNATKHNYTTIHHIQKSQLILLNQQESNQYLNKHLQLKQKLNHYTQNTNKKLINQQEKLLLYNLDIIKQKNHKIENQLKLLMQKTSTQVQQNNYSLIIQNLQKKQQSIIEAIKAKKLAIIQEKKKLSQENKQLVKKISQTKIKGINQLYQKIQQEEQFKRSLKVQIGRLRNKSQKLKIQNALMKEYLDLAQER